MRVLHIATRHRLGGGERKLLHSVECELRRGYEVEVAIGPESDLSQLPSNLPVHVVPTLVREVRPAADAKALRFLRSLVQGFDVVHTHYAKAGVLGRIAARGDGRTIMHTLHGASFGPGFSPLASTIFRTAERYCGRFTDLYVVVGEELRREYLDAGVASEERFRLVRSPVDVDAFCANRALTGFERAALAERLGFDPHRATILTMGALDPNKRQQLILDRVAPLLAGGEAQLVIAGAGRLHNALAARAAELGVGDHVHLIGHVAVPTELFACARVLVHAARAEGVPQVVIQALASGIPVVATEVTGLREIPGAPITVLPRGGGGLLSAVQAALTSRSQPLERARFDAWSTSRVEQQLDRVYELLEEKVRMKREQASAGTARTIGKVDRRAECA
jgi:glycosyltransferase involved in cell wall biosynthesis